VTGQTFDAQQKRRLTTGALVSALSIAAMFWWGVHFHVFGSDISFSAQPEQIGLVVLIVIAVFGVGYAMAGLPGGIRLVLGFMVLLVAAYLVGVVRLLLT
jgi:hypothetical protein